MKKKLFILLPLLAIPMSMTLTACNLGPAIGILEPDEHPALDAARKGFIAGLKDNGYGKINLKYANAKGNSADLNLLAKDLVSSSKLTLGIGTGASQALKGASDNAGSTNPLLFTAVTDPVDAGLVASKDNPSGYVCGTTDANPVEEQIALVKEFKKDASKLGIMYTQTETNSKVQSDQAEAAAKDAGLSVTIKTCSNASDVKATALALVDAGMDAIYIPTDNNVAANMNAVKEAAASKQVLLITGEENMLKSGGHVSLSIDYYGLGYSTGVMAAQILKGEKQPTDFKVVPVASSECSYVYSAKNLESSGLTMPEDLLSAHNWTNVD